MSQPVCLITGVGDGTGIALVRRFARSNYQVAMLARNRDRFGIDILTLVIDNTLCKIVCSTFANSIPFSPNPQQVKGHKSRYYHNRS